MRKRILPILMAIVMTLSLLPTAVLAAGNAYDELVAAIEAAPATGEQTRITLTGSIYDMTTDQMITIAEGQNIILDMDGYTITVASDFTGRPFKIEGTLTVTGNGMVDTTAAQNAYGVFDNYGSLTIENGTYESYTYAGGSVVKNRPETSCIILDGSFQGSPTAVYNEGITKIYNGTFEGYSCSRCNSNWGYTIQSHWNDKDAEKPQFYFYDGTVIGVQGAFSTSAGYSEVHDGTFETVACSEHGGGAAWYALYVAGESGVVECNVYGGTFTSASKEAAHIGNDTPGDGGERLPALINIHGGTFTGGGSNAVYVDGTLGGLEISGGTFSSAVDPKYCADGFAPSNEDGTFGVKSLFDSGTGTEEDPFVISREDDLNALRQSVAAGTSYAGKYFELGDNITLTASNWTPIGSQTAPFSGTFDGAKNTISGMTITAASGYTGFFGYLSGAQVKDLTIKDAAITCADDAWVGVLAGYAGGSSITDCSVSGSIQTDGVVGNNQSSNHGVAAAGVVEYLYQSTVLRTDSAVDISVATNDEIAYVGGIACEVNNSRIESCDNTGNVSGYSTYNTYDPSSGTGSVGYSYVGGIATYTKNSSEIVDCTNSGTVTSGHATDAVYATAGGILGQVWYENQATELVSGNTNTGAVTAAAQDGNSYAGGIVGESYQYNPDPRDPDYWSEETRSTITISENTNTGTVTAAGAAGGILGWGDAEWKLSLDNNTASGQEHTGDFGAPADMTFEDPDTYAYWDGCFHAFQVMRLGFDPEDDIIVGEEQTLVVNSGVTLSESSIEVQSGGQLVVEDGATLQSATVQPGGQLMVQDGANVGTVTVDGGGYLVSFQNEGVSLGQFATEADGTVCFPDQPSKNGYTFDGWYTDAGVRVSVGDKVNDNVTLTARWSKNVVPDTPSSDSSSDDGDYSIRPSGTSSHGSVIINPSWADKGDTVTLTVKPNDGYELGKLTVLDKGGDEIRVTAKGDNKYTFTMPAGNVTVEASFVRSGAQDTLPFVDVAADAYYYDAVKWAIENDVTQGVTATAFQPNSSCTRAQTVTFLWRAAGSPAPETTVNPFTDVSASDYYYEAVLWAVENGITQGTTATTFGPGIICTRAQVVTFLYRYSGEEAETASSFSDVAADAYYAGAVNWAVENGVTQGVTATAFQPNSSCTRAQIVTFLYRYMAA